MNLYAHDLSLFDFATFSDNPIFDPASPSNPLITSPDRDDEASAASRKSPPKRRHDGTSPLPLGMDWSPPPRKWDGRHTVWPHDPTPGWSYCVIVPSWSILSESPGSDPAVFYRVQVGVQSPEGVTSTRGIQRRFSDFLNLLTQIKKSFPKKKLPTAPPRRILRRTKSQTELEERRYSLEDWMEKLLSDIDISRSALVAMFLELEAAARSGMSAAFIHLINEKISFFFLIQSILIVAHYKDCTRAEFHLVNVLTLYHFPAFDEEDSSDAKSFISGMVPSFVSHENSGASVVAGSSFTVSGHDEFSEITSELGTQRHGNDHFADGSMEASTSEPNLFASLETPIKYGIFEKKFLMDSLGKFSHRNLHSGGDSASIGKECITNSAVLGGSVHEDAPELLPGAEYCKMDGHVRRLSTESVASDLSSFRASETSNLQIEDLSANGSLDLSGRAQVSKMLKSLGSDTQFQRNVLLAVLLDERNKLQKVLNTMHRRLGTAKTDMEDLIARLTQEVAMKQFLTMKVKDLGVELETTRENCKENMQQAVLNERERFTQMQWDMEELRKQCFELELKLKSEQQENTRVESEKLLACQENTELLQELDFARERLENLNKHHEDLEAKSKADVKVLVKEVKLLRSSQSELKQELSRLIKEKLELERTLGKEKMRIENAHTANAKLLHECEILQDRLQECSVNFLVEEEDKLIVDTSSHSEALDLLTTSDNRIGLLLAEAQLLAEDVQDSGTNGDVSDDDRVRMMLADTLLDNARLRKQMNSVLRCALNTFKSDDDDDDVEEEETTSRTTVLSKFLER